MVADTAFAVDISAMEDLYQQSKSLMKAHEWQAAIDLLSDRVVEGEMNWKLYWNRAWSLYKLGNHEAALKDFLGGLRHTHQPQDRATCLTFAGIVAMSLQRWEAATNYLMQSLTLDDTVVARKHLALAHLEQGATEAAEKTHLTGLKKFPDDKSRLAAYGDFLLDLGRIEDAQEVMQKLQ